MFWKTFRLKPEFLSVHLSRPFNLAVSAASCGKSVLKLGRPLSKPEIKALGNDVVARMFEHAATHRRISAYT